MSIATSMAPHITLSFRSRAVLRIGVTLDVMFLSYHLELSLDLVLVRYRHGSPR